MPGDDFRFTRELTALDATKLDRSEAREVEGLYRAKEYLATEFRDRLIEVESERDLLRTRVDRLRVERDSLRERLDGLEADRGSVAPDRLVASLGDAFASARDDLSTAEYAVGRVEVDLKANVVGGADGPRFQLPDLAEPVNREALSTLRFDLRPAARDEETAVYDPIPDVRDRSLSEARAAVQRGGFTVGEVTTEPGDADDVVLDQFPSSRSVAEPGSAVDLTVSERRQVDVPAVIGHDLADATAVLSAADLAVGEIDAETRDAPADAVIGQTPAAGEAVPVGTTVDLTVSAGPADGDRAVETEIDPESGSGLDLQAVDGIGPTYADRLRTAGVANVSTLLASDPAEVAEATGASTSRVEDWFGHARRLLEDE
jgi:predicted flap endonuclease-1-like 5' DNA nuclease